MLPSSCKVIFKSSAKRMFIIPTFISSLLVLTLGLTACENLNSQSSHHSHDNGQLQIDKLPSGQEIASGELIVVFKQGTSMTTVNTIANQYDMKVGQELGIINGYVFTSDKNVHDLQKTMAMLNNESSVSYAEYNGIAHAMGAVNADVH